MASRYSEYRIPENRSSSASIVSDDDDYDDIVVPTGNRKKNVILDSESEEEPDDKLPFHSTVIADHLLPNFEEMCVDNRDKRISCIAEQKCSLSANSDSEHDVFHSDEETEQKSQVKPRKSTRISLALGKLLTTDNEVVSAACYKSVHNAKGSLKNSSSVIASDDEDEKPEEFITLISSGDSESEEDDLVKNGNKKHFLNSLEKNGAFKNKSPLLPKHDGTVAYFSSDDNEDEIRATARSVNDSETILQVSEEGKNDKYKTKKVLVESHDGAVAHFSSDDSESENERMMMMKNRKNSKKKLRNTEGNGLEKKKPLVQLHDGTVAHFSSDDSESENERIMMKNEKDNKKELHNTEGSGLEKKKTLVQSCDGMVTHFSSDENEIEIDTSVEKEGNWKENLQRTEQESEKNTLKQKEPMQSKDDSDIFSISDSESGDENSTKKGGCIENLQAVVSNIGNNDFQESDSKNSGNIKLNQQNDTSEIQILKIENRLDKSKVSDIQTYMPVQRPQVTQSFSQLKSEIDVLTREIAKLKNILKCVDVNQLPDKGMKLQMKLQEGLHLLRLKERELKKMPIDSANEGISENSAKPTTNRLPVGFGIKALQTQIREKTLTEEALTDLHGSISTCPSENILADSPAGLKSSVELMHHQRHALAWLLWRETQRPPAGILADDMGLGKTLTMISLVLKVKEKREEEDESRGFDDEFEEDSGGYPLGGTLVVCPASLLLQWEDEIKKHCKRGILEVEIHHGTGREENARKLSQNDIVITTYSIVRTSANKAGKEETVKRSKRGVLHRVRWRRIILDEAHVVRNHKSQQSLAVCLLMGRKRWALTGTPIHNKELDLYALMKFLRCSPFDDYNVWRRWVDNKNTAGMKRLNTVINAIMLRRTKAVLQDKGELASLPEKNLQEIFIRLQKDEFEVYTKILWFSKTLFAQFLQQRADKEMFGMPVYSQPQSKDIKELLVSNPELAKMFNKMQQMRDIKTHEILVLLLRLRQICVHPGLVKAMLDEEAKQSNGIEDLNEEGSDVLSKMGAMSLEDHSPRIDETEHAMEEVLQLSNPVFDLTRMSSKMKAVFKLLEEKVVNTSDKGIIVSQWTSVLNIMYSHLVDFGVKCAMLSGTVPVKDRMDIVKAFNSERGSQVLLLSLTAGGVGLNLTGGNHLFLIDLHWNPQLESQAFDRVYRVGQKKPVFIYKFICQETIEERIKVLQDKKLSVAAGVLSGTMQRNVNKLTLQDLKSLFSM